MLRPSQTNKSGRLPSGDPVLGKTKRMSFDGLDEALDSAHPLPLVVQTASLLPGRERTLEDRRPVDRIEDSLRDGEA